MAYQDKKSTRLKGAVLSFIIHLIYYMPSFLVRWISLAFHKLSIIFNSKGCQVVRKNIQMCYPEKNDQQIDQLVKAYATQSACLIHEFATAWLGDKKAVQSKITSVINQQLVDEILASKQPLIVAVPHIGNWEFVWHWLQLNYPAIGMYKPANFKQVDELVLKSRLRFGGKGFAADRRGMMGLLKSLRQGGVMMILPDQQPQEGAGIFSPFFGQTAYTMTLLHKLVAKAEARLLFARCIRKPSDKSFELTLESPTFEIHQTTVENFNQGMNQQIANIINHCPEQYLWSYKRFKHQPEDKGNPYKS